MKRSRCKGSVGLFLIGLEIDHDKEKKERKELQLPVGKGTWVMALLLKTVTEVGVAMDAMSNCGMELVTGAGVGLKSAFDVSIEVWG